MKENNNKGNNQRKVKKERKEDKEKYKMKTRKSTIWIITVQSLEYLIVNQ